VGRYDPDLTVLSLRRFSQNLAIPRKPLRILHFQNKEPQGGGL
jgi:hypothetical protein